MKTEDAMAEQARALVIHELAEAVSSAARSAKTDEAAATAVAAILRSNVLEIVTDATAVGAAIRIRISSDLGYCVAERA